MEMASAAVVLSLLNKCCGLENLLLWTKDTIFTLIQSVSYAGKNSVNSYHLKGYWCTFRWWLLNNICFSSTTRSTLKGNNLLGSKCFPLKVDPFSVGLWCAWKQTGSQYLSLLYITSEIVPGVFSPIETCPSICTPIIATTNVFAFIQLKQDIIAIICVRSYYHRCLPSVVYVMINRRLDKWGTYIYL